MSGERQELSTGLDNLTTITRTWRLGGPMTAAQRGESKQIFLNYLNSDPNVSAACDLAQISRETAYNWREKDQKFATGWNDAIENLKNIARSSIYKRGIIGWDEVVVSQGQAVYEMEPFEDKDGNQVWEKGKLKMKRGDLMTVHKWSDSLASLYARANLPEYKDKQQIDLTAQITTMADSAKDELLADLSVAIANENKEPSDQG